MEGTRGWRRGPEDGEDQRMEERTRGWRGPERERRGQGPGGGGGGKRRRRVFQGDNKIYILLEMMLQTTLAYLRFLKRSNYFGDKADIKLLSTGIPLQPHS
jgi:hypothetical protein